MDTDSAPAASGTRAALIAAGLHLFGRDGFAATSTRALAAHAGTNVASIAYHFGGKDGLRLACGQEVMQRVAGFAGPADMPGPAPAPAPEQALALLETMLRAMAAFLTRAPQAADTVAFILREMTEEGPAFDLIYRDFFLPKHRQLCHLTAAAIGGDPESADIRLLVFSVLGQAVYFRLGQPLICRRMGWDSYGEAEAQAVADRLVANMHAILRGRPCLD